MVRLKRAAIPASPLRWRATWRYRDPMTAATPARPRPRPEILAIDAYVPGRSRVAGVAKVFKLSSNESPLGASPRAIEAFRASASDLARYPDGSATALREAIGQRYGL